MSELGVGVKMGSGCLDGEWVSGWGVGVWMGSGCLNGNGCQNGEWMSGWERVSGSVS